MSEFSVISTGAIVAMNNMKTQQDNVDWFGFLLGITIAFIIILIIGKRL